MENSTYMFVRLLTKLSVRLARNRHTEHNMKKWWCWGKELCSSRLIRLCWTAKSTTLSKEFRTPIRTLCIIYWNKVAIAQQSVGRYQIPSKHISYQYILETIVGKDFEHSIVPRCTSWDWSKDGIQELQIDIWSRAWVSEWQVIFLGFHGNMKRRLFLPAATRCLSSKRVWLDILEAWAQSNQHTSVSECMPRPNRQLAVISDLPLCDLWALIFKAIGRSRSLQTFISSSLSKSLCSATTLGESSSVPSQPDGPPPNASAKALGCFIASSLMPSFRRGPASVPS